MVSASPEVRSFGKWASNQKKGAGGSVGIAVYTPYGRFDMSRLLTLLRRVVVLRTH